MSRLNIARNIAHRDGIKIINKHPNDMELRGYNVSESIEPGKVDITLYHFSEPCLAWIVSDFDSSETDFASARQSARTQLRRVV